jgi:arylsulfatase A-like enzyme
LRGFKFDVYEGGIRVPMLLSGPGVPAGQACEHMVSSMDLFPTLLAAAGVEPPAGQVCDGINLLPCLQDASSKAPHETLFWKNRTWAGPTHKQKPLFGCYNSAVRRGNWKLVRTFHLEVDEKPDEQFLYNQPWQLFELSADIGEQHDVAAEYPQVVAGLEEAYEDWLSRMHPALFA